MEGFDENFDELFEKAINETTKTHDTLGDKVIANAETEFCGYSEEEKLRQAEIKELTLKMNSLKKELRGCSNVKNPRMTEANAQRSKKRRELKKNIALIHTRLQEIEEERKGATLSTKDMAAAMK